MVNPARLTATPRVLVVILCYNKVELTLACLASLRNVGYPRMDTLVVDNASTDDTVAEVQAKYPNVSILRCKENLGYAGGNNMGLRYALEQGYHYCLLLNNDTEVASDFMFHLVDVCEQDSTIGAVGPKIMLFDWPTVLWSAGGTVDWRRGGRTTMRGLGDVDKGQFETVQDVDFIPGCALLVRCSTLVETGLLDERFGMYYEETEWCVRMAHSGNRVVYVPASRIWHKVQLEQQDWAPYITYYMARNRLLFLRTTRASWQSWLYAIVFQDLRTWLSWRLRPKWRKRAPQRNAMVWAWKDYLAGRFGMLAHPL